jgi:predicted transposase YdaD
MTDKKNNNTKDIGKPKYDAFFKFNLEKQEVAQAYIKQVVPQELANLSDFSKMQLEPSEHIDPELRKLITDVLWSVPFKDSKYYTYFLCEHESGRLFSNPCWHGTQAL